LAAGAGKNFGIEPFFARCGQRQQQQLRLQKLSSIHLSADNGNARQAQDGHGRLHTASLAWHTAARFGGSWAAGGCTGAVRDLNKSKRNGVSHLMKPVLHCWALCA
jgi:hypothetical protein